MKQMIFLMILLFIGISSIQAQQTIEIKNVRKIYLNGEKIKINEAAKIINVNPKATQLMKSGRGLRTMSYFLAFGGGFALGTGLVSVYNAFDNGAVPLVLGVIGIGGSILLTHVGNKQIEKAIKTYNDGLAYNTNSTSTELSIVYNQSGIGLKLSF